MGKFNVKDTRAAAGRGPMKTKKGGPTLTTHEGGPGFEKKAKTELFLLAVSNMVGEDTFYEKAGDRDSRFRKLIHKVAVADPAWMLGMVGWLRGEANMRSASLVMAAEAVKARLDHQKAVDSNKGSTSVWMTDQGANRQIIAAALQRADEPGELLAYWTANYGRKIPKPVKRGVADAVRRLYSEYSLLKYDTASHGWRFADVLDLTHPAPSAPWQGALFQHALDRRHGRDGEVPEALGMVQLNGALRRSVAANDWEPLLSPELLAKAGMTWEDALSLAGPKVDKRKLWEALIPTMGYMALLRNLRNFDQAGVSDEVAEQVAKRLTDPEQVAKSRQLPFRFYSAYIEVPSDRWKHPLGKALDASLVNLPKLPGRTLVLIDTSASMTQCTISEKSKVTAAQAAAVLGIALAKSQGAEVHGWADSPYQYQLTKGMSALREIEGFLKSTGTGGHGTNIPAALRAYAGHDRVFLLSDMQTVGSGRNAWVGSDPGKLIPAHVPLYAYDLQGYRAAALSTVAPNRHQLGGYSDRVLQMVPYLERGEDATWPWETTG
jgi:hypothetical protein